MDQVFTAAASSNSRLESLAKRVKELESENRLLLSRISGCSRCSKARNFLATSFFPEETQQPDHLEYKNVDCMKYEKEEESGRQQKEMQHCSTRHVALKIMYFGKRFHGFASEAQIDPTIESEIFKALKTTKLLVSKDSNYSRCGRTDKGVSSTGQVISLYLRSNIKDDVGSEGRCEIDYVKVINRALPKDIRVMGWCPVSTTFNSRFSCLSREYKYYFWKGSLDITAMQTAGKKFIGEHDFRNFCKMDAANVSNYRRKVTSFEISSCSRRFDDDELWGMSFSGTAFLWHQVRCMVSVLFMIGQGLESPGIIDMLLDTDNIPRKPQYVMAPDLPLVLRSCEFEDTDFYCSPDSWRRLVDHLGSIARNYILQATIFLEAFNLSQMPGRTFSGFGSKKQCHIPLISRPTEPSYDERRAKLTTKNNLKISMMKEAIGTYIL